MNLSCLSRVVTWLILILHTYSFVYSAGVTGTPGTGTEQKNPVGGGNSSPDSGGSRGLVTTSRGPNPGSENGSGTGLGTDSASTTPGVSTPKVDDSHNQAQNKQGVELDIKSKKTTDQWSYTKGGNNNKLHTYEAKDNHAFNKVKQKKRICSDKDVWETSDPNLYASKVEYDENANVVTITLLNGTTKKFKKDANDNWTEESGQSGEDPANQGSGGTRKDLSYYAED